MEKLPVFDIVDKSIPTSKTIWGLHICSKDIQHFADFGSLGFILYDSSGKVLWQLVISKQHL